MVNLFMGMLGTGGGAWASGYVIPFRHMFMPFKALSPETRCFQDSWVFTSLLHIQWE